MTHILLHFLIPLLLAKGFYSKNWQKAYMILMATMLVDLDHLLATPIYDAARCSIGFHPLHQELMIGIYVLALTYKPLRLIALGLCVHMLLDWQDCYFKI
ncbi:DUF6122 family protein [uncultured Paraglaciecola sp.]|uniref:DUF6122 family protein n=1 Tax=uncultured Paraglaciecola sp. TaxID=1765024 RepID=UPI002639358C|nr:DUF6122 family protein [uncultured Paraglaciecola sp.]